MNLENIFFLQFVNDENQFKPTNDEIYFLKNYINEYRNNIVQDENNNKIIPLLPKIL